MLIEEKIIQDIAEGFSTPKVGDEFFKELADYLHKALKVDYVFIGHLSENCKTAQTILFSHKGNALPEIEYDLEGTPCELVIKNKKYNYYENNIRQLFPEDVALTELKVNSYAGIPLLNNEREPLGLLSVLHSHSIQNPELIEHLFKIVARRVELEIERKAHEENLEHKERLLEEAQKIAHIGSFEWDIQNDRSVWSDELYRIYGYEPGEIEVNMDIYTRHIHPDHVQQVRQELETALRLKQSFEKEYCIIDKKGNEKILSTKGNIITDQHNNPVKVLGVCHDITQRKTAENALKKLVVELEERIKTRTKDLKWGIKKEEFLRSIIETTIGSHLNEEDLLKYIAGKTGRFLSTDCCYILHQQAGGKYQIEGSFYSSDKIPHISGQTLQYVKQESQHEATGNLLLVKTSDLTGIPEKLKPSIKDMNAEAFLLYQFRIDEESYGYLVLYQEKSRSWRKEELQLIDDVLNLLNNTLARLKSLRKEKEAEIVAKTASNKLNLVINAAPGFISYINANLEFELVNDAYVKAFNKEKHEIAGQKVKKIIGEEAFANSRSYVEKVLKGRAITFENTILDKNGAEKHLIVHYVPDINDIGVIKGFIVLGTDITEQKQFEKALQKAGRKLKIQRDNFYNLLKEAPALICVLKGPDLVFEFVNDNYQKLAGKLELKGKSIKELSRSEKGQQYIKLLEQVYTTGKTNVGKEVSLDIQKEDGTSETRFYDFIYQARRNDEGDIDGVIAYANDITDQVIARKMEEEFLGMASHELKTPLTTIVAYSELLEEQLRNEEKIAPLYLSKITSNLKKLDHLITDFLDVGRIQAGQLQLNLENFSFDTFIKECVENIQPTIKTHNILLQGKTNKTIKADRQRMEQVLINLISNAVKYSPEADKVIVNIASENEHIKTSITDFGIGIPKEKMHQLFQRFYRANDTNNRIAGLGIGLYIAKEIVVRHRGKIWVESEKDKGSTFHFTIPAQK